MASNNKAFNNLIGDKKMHTYQDFCKNITDKIFAIIDEKGSLLTWQKDWDGKGCCLLPIGMKNLYHGSNLFSLFYAQWEHGFASNQWLTFTQVQK